MKFVVTEQGPIDRLPPGTDVTGVYPDDVLQRLIAEGYIADVTPKPKPAATSKRAKKEAGDDGS